MTTIDVKAIRTLQCLSQVLILGRDESAVNRRLRLLTKAPSTVGDGV